MPGSLPRIANPGEWDDNYANNVMKSLRSVGVGYVTGQSI